MTNDNNQLPAVHSVWRKGDEWRQVESADDAEVWYVVFASEVPMRLTTNDWLAWAADATCVSEGGE